jgi:hypothetical protein
LQKFLELGLDPDERQPVRPTVRYSKKTKKWTVTAQIAEAPCAITVPAANLETVLKALESLQPSRKGKLVADLAGGLREAWLLESTSAEQTLKRRRRGIQVDRDGIQEIKMAAAWLYLFLEKQSGGADGRDSRIRRCSRAITRAFANEFKSMKLHQRPSGVNFFATYIRPWLPYVRDVAERFPRMLTHHNAFLRRISLGEFLTERGTAKATWN